MEIINEYRSVESLREEVSLRGLELTAYYLWETEFHFEASEEEVLEEIVKILG